MTNMGESNAEADIGIDPVERQLSTLSSPWLKGR
jgi:hypothetical protein